MSRGKHLLPRLQLHRLGLFASDRALLTRRPFRLPCWTEAVVQMIQHELQAAITTAPNTMYNRGFRT
jgi:hypothetical protein